jgi:hypothetical protein
MDHPANGSPGLQDIELVEISQEVLERFYKLSFTRVASIGRIAFDPRQQGLWSSAKRAPGGDQVLFAGRNLPPSHSQVDRSLSILRVQDVGFHSGQSLLHGFKIEAGARELGRLRIFLL